MPQPIRARGSSSSSPSSSPSSIRATCDPTEIRSNTVTPDPEEDCFGMAIFHEIEDHVAEMWDQAGERAFSAGVAFPQNIPTTYSAGAPLGYESTQEGGRNGGATAGVGYPVPWNPVSHHCLGEHTTPNELQSNSTRNTARPESPRLRPRNTNNNQLNGNTDLSSPGFSDGFLPGSAPNIPQHEDRGQRPRNPPNGQINGNGRSEQPTAPNRFQPNDTQNTPRPESRRIEPVNGNERLASHTTNSVSSDENSSEDSE
ncbi:hypothetical protein EMCG_00356 [[Emmonsia] crescens]|uniref:Uncharacterized protein n=1 Tax=[Emmonsia] crescens TaxID=73230 RepID=A0A0G2HX50_9EURO|nr:hypothetical protein EMCG_00356 [Emmonsia crescens UAMH 3008]